MKMNEKMIELTTYPMTPEGNITATGNDTVFMVPESYVKSYVQPQTVEDFLDNYTYDDSYDIYHMHQAGVNV